MRNVLAARVAQGLAVRASYMCGCVIVFASVRRISQAARNRPELGMSAQTSVKYVEGGRQMNERRDNHARGGPT